MTLSAIVQLAWSRLGEDPEDLASCEALLRGWCNEGYWVAASEWLKPRGEIPLELDEKDNAPISGLVLRVLGVKDGDGRSVRFGLTGDGRKVHLFTLCHRGPYTALAQIAHPPMTDWSEEPKLPEAAHAALADYICYRHLSGGNAAQQQKGLIFREHFRRVMATLIPEGEGSVRDFNGLYAVTGKTGVTR